MSDTVHNSSCSYVNLQNYNSQYAGTLGKPSVGAAARAVSGYYVVPSYSAIGYNALTHGQEQPSCNGYFNITSAYGAGANDCDQQYGNRSCM